MKQFFASLLTIVTTLVVAACIPQQEQDYFTVVEGFAQNKYSGQPVARLPVVVHRTWSNWSGSFSDSVTATQTDATGRYSLSFDAKAAGSYKVTLARQNEYFDINNGDGGFFKAQTGGSNKYNFDVTPYKTVTLNATANKGGKTDISFGCVTWDQGPWYYSMVFQDTVKANQTIQFSRTFQVVPNRLYWFSKITQTRFRPPNMLQYSFKDVVSTSIYRVVGYNDTTVVIFR